MDNRGTMYRALTFGAFGVALVAVVCAAGGRDNPATPREVTLTGRVVDLHCFMTGKFSSSDKARCTRDCIMAGVPSALETEGGLVLVSEGSKGAARALAPLAYQLVEIKGKLYEKNGIRYVDLMSAKLARSEPVQQPQTEQDENEDQNPQSENEDNGACCLPGGRCIVTDAGNCADNEGQYFAGLTCDDVECEE